MLRLFVILLLLANSLFYAWSQGFLAPWGSPTESASEPQRIAAQIEPERIVVLPNLPATKPTPATQTVAATTAVVPLTTLAPISPLTPLTPVSPVTPVTPVSPMPAQPASIEAAPVCLTSGVFDAKQVSILKPILAEKLSNIIWKFEPSNIPAVWIVYMGKYPNKNARDLKKSQLDQINVKYELLAEKSLEPGLSLGSYSNQAAATQALQQLVKQGVRTARVLQEFPEQNGESLVIPAIDEANRAKLNTAYAALSGQLGNKVLKVCSR
jgi:hypothetical protein